MTRRYIGSNHIHHAMAAHYDTVHTVFVVCVICGTRHEMTGSWTDLSGYMSDAEAVQRFTEMGWLVEAGNVRCPKHHATPLPYNESEQYRFEGDTPHA